MSNCVVDLDIPNPDRIFLSGQEVAGSVTYYNEKPRLILSLLLKVQGFVETSWTEESGSGDSKSSTSHSAREDYISTTSYLVGDGQTELELPAGHHSFNFLFAIPSELPSSFHSFYGKVVYQIKVEVDRRFRLNKSFIFPLKVVGQLDLNHDGDALRQPLRAEISKKFFLAGSSPLTICATIPVRGYCPGQIFTIDVEVVNDSKLRVEEMVFSFYQMILYKTRFVSTKRDCRLLLGKNHNGVDAKAQSKMSFSFEMPPVDATNISCCRFIHITYEVVIEAKVGGLHRSPMLRMPITIGTIPLKGFEKHAESNKTQ